LGHLRRVPIERLFASALGDEQSLIETSTQKFLPLIEDLMLLAHLCLRNLQTPDDSFLFDVLDRVVRCMSPDENAQAGGACLDVIAHLRQQALIRLIQCICIIPTDHNQSIAVVFSD
jgi:hypothetical protein